MPDAGRWYLTSPVPPSGSTTSASSERSPSNSRRIDWYERPTVWTSALSRPRWAIPITTSCAPPARGELDRLVEHRDERLETLERELLLPEERPAQVLLEALGLGEPVEERAPLLRGERLPEAPRLDRLAEPDALGVVGDVLDLVGDRARVDVAEERQRLEQRVALDVEAEQRGRDARLQLRRQRRDEAGLVERRVAHRLGAERVEPGGEVPVHAVGLDERHRRGDAAEEVLVDRWRLAAPSAACRGARRAAAVGGGDGAATGVGGGAGAADGRGRRAEPARRAAERSRRRSGASGAAHRRRSSRRCRRPASPGSEPVNAAGSRSKSSRHSCEHARGRVEVGLEHLGDVARVQPAQVSSHSCDVLYRSRAALGEHAPAS